MSLMSFIFWSYLSAYRLQGLFLTPLPSRYTTNNKLFCRNCQSFRGCPLGLTCSDSTLHGHFKVNCFQSSTWPKFNFTWHAATLQNGKNLNILLIKITVQWIFWSSEDMMISNVLHLKYYMQFLYHPTGIYDRALRLLTFKDYFLNCLHIFYSQSV